MVRDKIIRAWKDPEYRVSLSEEELNTLPENPAGAIELTDEELDAAVGGSWRQSFSASSASRSQSNSQSMSRRSFSWRRPYSQSFSNSGSFSRSYSRSYSGSYSGSYSSSRGRPALYSGNTYLRS